MRFGLMVVTAQGHPKQSTEGQGNRVNPQVTPARKENELMLAHPRCAGHTVAAAQHLLGSACAIDDDFDAAVAASTGGGIVAVDGFGVGKTGHTQSASSQATLG